MLSAYQGILARDQSREDLAEHYKTMLEDMTGDQSSALVLSAQAGAELAKNTPEGNRQAIKDLSKAVELDSKFPKDYLLLAELHDRSGDLDAAIKVLSIATERFPYNPAPYKQLVACYRRAGQAAKASEILHRGLELFPADRNLLQLAAKSGQP
jgi:tetratricopeptide (TPR) repeat protein